MKRPDQATTAAETVAQVRQEVGQIPDPEIPVVTLAELGILRDVSIVDSIMTVTLTPTYSGCPATEAIAGDVRTVLQRLGHAQGRVRLTLSPPWTTDWITESAREKLRAYGIAPPCHSIGSANSGAETNSVATIHFMRRQPHAEANSQPACPRCDSKQTECLSEFGSTPCKAMYRCLACREPFDYFKPF